MRSRASWCGGGSSPSCSPARARCRAPATRSGSCARCCACAAGRDEALGSAAPGPRYPEKRSDATMIKTVAVGTDGSDTAAKAVEFAIDLAERYEAKIVFLSAYKAASEE